MLALRLRLWLLFLATLLASSPSWAGTQTRVRGIGVALAECIYREASVKPEGVREKRRAGGGSTSEKTFGTKNVEAGNDPLTYGFAGEPFEPVSKLAYHRARWMDARVGRFAGMDRFDGVRASHPGYLHNYSYVYGNAVNDTDPSGLIDSIDISAATAIGGILATEGEPIFHTIEAEVPVVEAELTVAAQEGATLLEETGAQVQVLAPGARSFANWVWSLNPFQRGRAIEEALAPGQLFKSPNFPVIDTFVEGVATSIKSINLNAVSYANPGAIVSRLTSYVNALSNFNGASWGGDVVEGSEITARQLLLAIPPGATQAQIDAINQIAAQAQTLATNPVVVTVVVVQ